MMTKKERFLFNHRCSYCGVPGECEFLGLMVVRCKECGTTEALLTAQQLTEFKYGLARGRANKKRALLRKAQQEATPV